MTKHHDESMALAALFDCWTPIWKKIYGPYHFRTNIGPALGAFGFDCVSSLTSPFMLARSNKRGGTFGVVLEGQQDEAAILCEHADLRSHEFIRVFRRLPPHHMILSAKSGLWWSVWDGLYKKTAATTIFHISTAEYIPSKNRA